MATIADRRLLTSFSGRGGGSSSRRDIKRYSGTAVSETVTGQSISLTAINSLTLFGKNNKLITTLIIEGRDSGARTTIPVEISKVVVKSASFNGETGISLA